MLLAWILRFIWISGFDWLEFQLALRRKQWLWVMEGTPPGSSIGEGQQRCRDHENDQGRGNQE